MTIELTDEQCRALQAGGGKPVDVLDLATSQRYVLLAQAQYERVRSILERDKPAETTEGSSSDIPPGILRSQQALWRELPELLKIKRNHGRWVCYHGDERIGIARTKTELLRQCVHRKLRDDEYYTAIIQPDEAPPWEDVEVERRQPHEIEANPPRS